MEVVVKSEPCDNIQEIKIEANKTIEELPDVKPDITCNEDIKAMELTSTLSADKTDAVNPITEKNPEIEKKSWPNINQTTKLEFADDVHSLSDKQEAGNNEDNEIDDLPDNFFEDFSNTDFMAGLDIVDDWIDESVADKGFSNIDDGSQDGNIDTNIETKDANKSTNSDKKDSKEKSLSDRSKNVDRCSKEKEVLKYKSYGSRAYSHSRERSLSRGRRSRDRSPIRMRRSRSRDKFRRSREGRYIKEGERVIRGQYRGRYRSRDRYKSKSREKCDKYYSDKPNKSPGKRPSNDGVKVETNLDLADCRRDPEKTKRDIQRDKIRCEKDLKARVFQEQLKVAETGLVPPGEELEVVLKSDKFNEDLQKTKKISGKPNFKTRFDNPPKEKFVHKRERSPLYVQIHQKPNKLVYEDPSVDLRIHLRQKREKFTCHLSPVSDINAHSPMELSPESVLSERESWLRSKDRTKHYGRSCSPISSNSLSDHGGSPKSKRFKPSFMEEIQQKLRHQEKALHMKSFHNDFNRYGSGSAIHDVPQPVPPPQTEFYNINPYSINNQMFPMPEMVPQPYVQEVPPVACNPGMVHPMGAMRAPLLVTPMIPPNMEVARAVLPHPSTKKTPPAASVNTNLKPCSTVKKTEITKLFEDKKITLSDYLSVSAKSLDAKNQEKNENKIKVLSRCQQAIEALEQDILMPGRFFPKLNIKATDAYDKFEKWRSPLRKVPTVRFKFTTPIKGVSPKPDACFFVTINKLLASVGAEKLPVSKPVNAVTQVKKVVPPESSKTPAAATPAPPSITPKRVKYASVPIQTDPFKCKVCEKRESIHRSQQGVQTEEKKYVEASTQVNIEDLTKSCTTFTPRGILKNSSSIQSISHLTPAQLLAQMSKKEETLQAEDRSDIFTSPGHQLIPEKKPLLPNNDLSYTNRPNMDNFNMPTNISEQGPKPHFNYNFKHGSGFSGGSMFGGNSGTNFSSTNSNIGLFKNNEPMKNINRFTGNFHNSYNKSFGNIQENRNSFPDMNRKPGPYMGQPNPPDRRFPNPNNPNPNFGDRFSNIRGRGNSMFGGFTGRQFHN